MFAPLLDGIRADIDRQIGWAKAEVRRQTRYRALIAVVAGVAALAALGAIVVGLHRPLFVACDASQSFRGAWHDRQRVAAGCADDVGASVRLAAS